MVNGNFDKNKTCSNSKSEEIFKQQTRIRDDTVSPSSSDCMPSSSRKFSNDETPSESEQGKDCINGEEDGSRAMAEVSAKTSLLCSVPLNKIRCVLSSAGGKTDEEENSPKINQTSRKLLCLYCDRSFVSSNLRQKHVERCHSEKQSRRLSSRKLQSQFTTTACFYCDKLPVEHSLRQLFEHLISAHSSKYFGCLLCEERFLNQIQINDHNTKFHNFLPKEQQKVHQVKIDKGPEKNDEPSNTTEVSTDENTNNEQKSTRNTVKKKKSTANSKPPPRQLRNRKKVTVKTSKVGLKRSNRLKSAQSNVPVRKKKTKTVETAKLNENAAKTTDKVKTIAVNPYPEFDSYYRVKKITDHSIDNLKISSLTFDDVFDKAFFSKIKCNIQENLLYHLDGKLFKNKESESRISNFEKNPPTQEVSSSSSENFGCDLSLNAVTPVTSICTANFGEDLESQIEYGSKPSKKKLQIRQDPVRHKYVTRRKYQASILEHKENRDLSKLDMWTQLVIKDRQQKVLNGQKSAKEILEYTTCDEYKLKIQRNELNRILDRRGPFEDLKEEASKKATLEQLNSDSNNEMSEECFKEVRFLMEDLLAKVIKNCSEDEEHVPDILKLSEKAEFLDKEDIPELPDYLKLRRTSSVPSEEEIDKSDKIALICSSQETENYELPTNTVRSKDEMIELSGEWARSRIYVCAACGLKVPNMKFLIDHKSMYHQNSWVQHYELVGNQSELYRHLCIPGLGKVGQVEETIPCKSWLKSESRVCTKCGKVCNSLSELHRHILECGGDWTWMLARKKCKYRPFGARKKKRGLVKRIRECNQKTDSAEKKKYKKTFEGPRQRPSDADTIQRMLANLPPKRASRKTICMKDGFPRNRQKSPKNKKQVMKCGKIVRHKSTYNTNVETTKNTSVRQTLRSISRTLSSKILDTNSKLKVKRKLIQRISRRSPRKNLQNVSESTDHVVINGESEEKILNSGKKTINNSKTKHDEVSDKVKCVFKDKVNMKTFFPVSKRKASKNISKTESDTSQSASTLKEKMDTNLTKSKSTKNVIQLIKNSFKFHKTGKMNPNNVANKSGNSEPIVVIEKLPQTEQVETKPPPSTKRPANKRKLRSSFRKVIDKVKKLKLDNNTSVPSEKNDMNAKHMNSFLGQGSREKEKLATVLVPLVEELKENPISNLAFAQNAMDNNSPTEESLIPENIFDLQHNSENLLQAKSPLEAPTFDVKKNDIIKYFSAKVINVQESTDEGYNKSSHVPLETKNDVVLTQKIENLNNTSVISPESDDTSKAKEMSFLSIETSARSDISPLVSPILSPSMLSPKMKGKIRKPNRGLNDCIAMLTKKAFEETNKTEVPVDHVNPTLNNKNEAAPKIIRAKECILKIPVIESNPHIQSGVLDLSKPKKNVESNVSQMKNIDLPTSKLAAFWNPVDDIKCSSPGAVNDSKMSWPIITSTKTPSEIANSCTDKAILKIPKFVEVSRSNNIDNIIQGVIENYDEAVITSETVKPYLKVPSIGLLNSVDRVIEEVVKGNFAFPSNEPPLIQLLKLSSDKIMVPKEVIGATMHMTLKSKKATKKNTQGHNVFSVDDSPIFPTNVPLSLKQGMKELEISPSKELLEAPQKMFSSSVDFVVGDTNMETVDTSPATLPKDLLGKSKNSTEYSSATFEENKSSIKPEVVPEKLVDVSSVSKSVKKKPCKKNGEMRKRTTKKMLKKLDEKIKTETKEEKAYEENDKLKITTYDEISTISELNEPDILEDKDIPVNNDNIISSCEDESPIQPNNQSGGFNLSSETAAVPDCSDIEKVLIENVNFIQGPSRNELVNGNEEHMKIGTIPVEEFGLSREEEIKAKKIFSEENAENEFKTNSTDSEDEIPLFILRSRSKKECWNAIKEGTETDKSELDTETEAKMIILSECGKGSNEQKVCKKWKDETTENLEDMSKRTETTENKIQQIKLISEESVTEKNELLNSDKYLEGENAEITLQNDEERRKSPRKTTNPVIPKHDKNGKKLSKGKKSKQSKHKISSKLEEPINEGKTVENVSNVNEPIQPRVTCLQDKNTSMEKKLISNPSSNSVTIDAPDKPKNFLVGTSVSSLKSPANSLTFSSKPSKKKNKNKHNAVKTKLIFKFPKIILKEPVLRIPPRDIAEGTSFGNKSENLQDTSIKLVLDNPFSNIKEREEKILSLNNFPDISGKKVGNEIPTENKSPSKKKSTKHKRKSSKSSVKLENKCEGSSDECHALFDNAVGSVDLNVPVQSSFKSLSDNSGHAYVPSYPETIPHDISDSVDQQNGKSELSLKQPITVKLQTSSSKRLGSKNLKKRKNKLKKSNLSNVTSECSTISQNIVSSLKETDISNTVNVTPENQEIKESHTYQVVDKIENDDKDSPVLQVHNNTFSIEDNQTSFKNANEVYVFKSLEAEMKESVELPTDSKSPENSTIDDNEMDIPVKSGRSLRSTVKITYKQSNIFALQIEGKEITDLNMIEKPKNLLPEQLLEEEKSNNFQHCEPTTAKEIVKYDFLQNDIKISLDEEENESEHLLENVDREENISITCLNKKKEETFDEPIKLPENQSKLEIKELDPEIENSLSKSRKSKKLSKSKKVLNEAADICSTLEIKSSLSMEISEGETEKLGVNAAENIENKVLKEIIDIPIKTPGPNIFQNPLEIYGMKPTEDFLSLGRDEDSSFSEGELVINESFEYQETNISEESIENQRKDDSFANNEINKGANENELVFNCSSNVIDPKKSQKNKRNKRGRSSKSLKILDHGNNALKPILYDNSSEIPTFERNKNFASEEMGEKKIDFSSEMNKFNSIVSDPQDMRNISEHTLKVETVPGKKDEFIFEDLLPMCNLSIEDERKNNYDTKYGYSVMKTTPCCDKKLESSSNSFFPSDVNSHCLNKTKRKQRSAKSKALQNINIIEKKIHILDIELSPSQNTHYEKPVSSTNKKKAVKHKASHMENIESVVNLFEFNTDELIFDKEESCKINDVSPPLRKGRAAKAKAIQNIKVLETNENDMDENEENLNDIDENEKLKITCKSKENLSSQIESSNMNMSKGATRKKIKDNIQFPSLSHELSSPIIEKSSLKINGTQSITKMNGMDIISENSEIQHESRNFIFLEKNTNTDQLQKSELKKLDDSILNREKENKISSVKKDKIPKYKSSRNNDATIHEIEGIAKFPPENSTLIKLFSSETNSDIYQKHKMNEDLFGTFERSNKTDCYDISCIDDDNKLECEESIPLSPLKRKKPIKNDTKLFLDDIKENCGKTSTQEVPITKNRDTKVKALENIFDVSRISDSSETDQIDSLDVTLKTTVDEISSILMENLDNPVIPNCSTNDFGATIPQVNPRTEYKKNRNSKKHGEDQRALETFDEYSDKTLKKKRNRDSSCENFMLEKEKVMDMEVKTTFETESKRRSKRACKVNTYNENELAEAIFEHVASEKDKITQKKADDVLHDSSNSITSKIYTEKKLNSDELFDLLKTTAPDNLIALKPVEENPSGTPNTDDNFDDEFDDILRKSQALFGDKPYKKLDDICRSDDSSSASKLTDFGKLDENTESNETTKKSEQSNIDDTSFNNSVISAVSKKPTSKSEGFSTDGLYCDICKKSFKRIDNLIKHRTTLTHIAKLSEMEAKEAENKFVVQSNENSSFSNVAIGSEKRSSSENYSFPNNTNNDALKIAEIITEAFEKPASHAERVFSEMINTSSEYRRYKSLGERKSFEYDQDSPNIDANHYEPKISKNTGVILEKQINLLQNIVGLDCENDTSSSSYRSLGKSIRGISPVSELSTKLEDSSSLAYHVDLDGDTERKHKIGSFLKPPQIEDISEDSTNPKNSEDVKSRKVLNRDEELFLECCSLLKSGSEVSNFSKKSNRNSYFNNGSIKMSEEPDVLESKNIIYKVTEDSSDYSRRATPLGDSFGDTSNSNTISSSWELNQNDQSHKNQENNFNFSDAETDTEKNRNCFNSSDFKNPVSPDSTKLFPPKQRKTNLKLKFSKKAEQTTNKSNQNMPTKGALKIFEGLKDSEQKLDSHRKNTSANVTENNSSESTPSGEQFVSPKTPRRKSKPVKNKPQIDDRFIFKVSKKPSLKDVEETKSVSKEIVSDKISDVYDFEETQDNTEVFTKPDFKSFRTKGTDIKDEAFLDNNYEAQTMSSSSSSNLSSKKGKMNECITKKKHMIMGRIFKNAVKPKLDEEIRDIPAIDHTELVENYVMSCTPKHEEAEFKKPKMTEEEMNDLFDKLLDKPAEIPKKASLNKIDHKNTGTKKKLKMKCKKRQRSNSDSTDDEFGLNKIVKKRPGRKNAREEDNSINLEQELKECIGVASRKSQRKCTSGKQNVLVEYWSSDESAFETLIENHLQELSEKSDLPISRNSDDKQEFEIPKENPPQNPTCGKTKKSRAKPKITSKKKEIKEVTSPNDVSKTSVPFNRRKRTAAHPLYHWSSSSDDELQDFIEVKSVRDDPEDGYDEERPIQHGWIVGDSPKKLVTMLAQAKGKKTEPESLVKEQGKKKNSNS